MLSGFTLASLVPKELLSIFLIKVWWAEAEPSGEAASFNFMMRSKPYIEVLTSGRGSESPGAKVLTMRFSMRSGLVSVLNISGKFYQIKVKFYEVFHYICAMFSSFQNTLKPAPLAVKRYFSNVLPMFYLCLKCLFILLIYRIL